jgi:hypothetical protein
VAERQYDFAALHHQVIDFESRQPFPANVVPLSRLDPVAVQVANTIPLSNSDASIGDNSSFQSSGSLPSVTHFDSGDIGLPGFGGFTSVPSQAGSSMTATFELFVDGLVALSREVTFPVD